MAGLVGDGHYGATSFFFSFVNTCIGACSIDHGTAEPNMVNWRFDGFGDSMDGGGEVNELVYRYSCFSWFFSR